LKADSPCRFCGASLTESFADLGMSPLSNGYIRPGQRNRAEPFYPLHAWACGACHLVQLEQFESPEHIFSDYLYFSSYSDSWLRHCETYAGRMIERFGLGGASRVVEIASNDGYLLQYFKAGGIPVHGVEPAANVAQVAIDRGIPSDVAFFGAQTARRLAGDGLAADLMAANNVLAHVPDINDFIAGFAILLKPAGVATFEFPSLHRLMAQSQFDTIYHEHFSYLSLLFVEQLMARHGLRVFDVEELPTHGGSLRVYACHAGASHIATPGVEAQRRREHGFGMADMDTYRAFSRQVVDIKAQVLEFFLAARREGKRVAGYGAPAKGNTLLNYCGVGPEFMSFTVDRSPHKQGMLLPGSRIPVLHPDAIGEAKPDYVFILPWNLREEIAGQMAAVRQWGGRFVVPIPALEIF
jgi:SAM-dependent methyltransferase